MFYFPINVLSLQTFAIPGSIFLSILSGYLFPAYTALLIVCTVSVTLTNVKVRIPSIMVLD